MLEDFFENNFKMEKAYHKFFHEELEQYDLTPNELLVILFLVKEEKNANTARDIAQYEGVSKALVARSVESLTERGYLTVERDETDRRICRLHLTQTCRNEIIDKIIQKKRDFFKQMMHDIPEDDIRTTERTLKHFLNNIAEHINEKDVP